MGIPDNSQSLQCPTCRLVAVTSSITVEICVPLATALQWFPDLHVDAGLLFAAADREAARRVRHALRERGIGPGRWRATFTGGDAVEYAPAT